MPLPADLHAALGRVHDQASLVNELLGQTLQWPIAGKVERLRDIAYEWTDDDLRSQGLLRDQLEDGKVSTSLLHSIMTACTLGTRPT